MTPEEISIFLTRLEEDPAEVSNHLNTLYKLLEEDRDEAYRIIMLLSYEYSPRHEELFIRYLDHKDEILRSQAADALCQSSRIDVLNKLKELAKRDESYLVRGYAVQSVYDVYLNIYQEEKDDELIDFYLELLSDEEDGWVQAILFSKLYFLGEVKYMENLVPLLQDEDYQIRISAVLSLDEILDEGNARIIRQLLEKAAALEINQVVSVKEKIRKVLERITAEHPQ